MTSSPENTCSDDGDKFDTLPDPIILSIFNNISDIKTLTRCRLVSRRFNSLVPHSDSLSLRVDRVISAVDSDESHNHHHNTTTTSSAVITFFRSIVRSLHDLISPNGVDRNDDLIDRNGDVIDRPAVILRGFERIKELTIELPSGDLRLEKKAVIRWTAEYGRSLRSCVILGFRYGGVGESELGGGGGLKTRVVWTISSLIAASARHYMVKDIVNENIYLNKLIVKDRENEGLVIMNKLGINEFRDESDNEKLLEEEEGQNGNLDGGVWWRSNRTRVPAVWMRMRHEARLELSNGVVMEGATLVVVRPTSMNTEGDGGEEKWDEGLVANRFEGVYGEAVAKLIKRRSYLLEMNSF